MTNAPYHFNRPSATPGPSGAAGQQPPSTSGALDYIPAKVGDLNSKLFGWRRPGSQPEPPVTVEDLVNHLRDMPASGAPDPRPHAPDSPRIIPFTQSQLDTYRDHKAHLLAEGTPDEPMRVSGQAQPARAPSPAATTTAPRPALPSTTGRLDLPVSRPNNAEFALGPPSIQQGPNQSSLPQPTAAPQTTQSPLHNLPSAATGVATFVIDLTKSPPHSSTTAIGTDTFPIDLTSSPPHSSTPAPGASALVPSDNAPARWWAGSIGVNKPMAELPPSNQHLDPNTAASSSSSPAPFNPANNASSTPVTNDTSSSSSVPAKRSSTQAGLPEPTSKVARVASSAVVDHHANNPPSNPPQEVSQSASALPNGMQDNAKQSVGNNPEPVRSARETQMGGQSTSAVAARQAAIAEAQRAHLATLSLHPQQPMVVLQHTVPVRSATASQMGGHSMAAVAARKAAIAEAQQAHQATLSPNPQQPRVILQPPTPNQLSYPNQLPQGGYPFPVQSFETVHSPPSTTTGATLSQYGVPIHNQQQFTTNPHQSAMSHNQFNMAQPQFTVNQTQFATNQPQFPANQPQFTNQNQFTMNQAFQPMLPSPQQHAPGLVAQQLHPAMMQVPPQQAPTPHYVQQQVENSQMAPAQHVPGTLQLSHPVATMSHQDARQRERVAQYQSLGVASLRSSTAQQQQPPSPVPSPGAGQQLLAAAIEYQMASTSIHSPQPVIQQAAQFHPPTMPAQGAVPAGGLAVSPHPNGLRPSSATPSADSPAPVTPSQVSQSTPWPFKYTLEQAIAAGKAELGDAIGSAPAGFYKKGPVYILKNTTVLVPVKPCTVLPCPTHGKLPVSWLPLYVLSIVS